MPSTPVDLVKLNITTVGTGAFGLGAPASGFRSRDALIDGAMYSYTVQQGAAYEIGRGVYSEAAATLTRVPLFSTSAGYPVPFSAGAQIAFVFLAEDLPESTDIGNLFLGNTLTGQGNGPYWAQARASDNILFVLVTNDFRLKSYDISTPGMPVFLDDITVGPAPAYLAIHGNNVFVTDQGQMSVRAIDASNPADLQNIGSPFVFDSTGGNGGARCDITPDGNYLVAGGAESGSSFNNCAAIVNISNPASMSLAGRTGPVGSTHRGIACLSNTAFAIASRDNKTAYFYDMTIPATPTQASAFVCTLGNTLTPMTADRETRTLYAANYSASGAGYLFAINYTDLAAPVLRSAVAMLNGAEQIALTGTGRALVALRPSHALVEVDISAPDAMVNLETLTFDGTITPGVAYLDGFAYVTCAGDTTNGKLFCVAVDPNLGTALSTLQTNIATLDRITAKLTGTNLYTGKGSYSSATPLDFTSETPSIKFGLTAPDYLVRTSAANFSMLGVQLTYGSSLYYGTGSIIRAKQSAAVANFTYIVDVDGDTKLGSGTLPFDVRLRRSGVGRWGLVLGSFVIEQVGQGLRIAEGVNAKQGRFTLVAGVATIPNTSVTASSEIFLQRQIDGGTVGASYSITRINATSFTVTAKDGAGATQTGDTSTLAFLMNEPA